MTDFNKILDKAKELESKMKESQENIKKIRVEGISGSNSVKVTLDGEGEMQKIEISDEILKEEKSIVEIQQEKNLSMREMLAKIWGIDEGKSPFATEEAPKKKSGKTESGQKATNVSVNPELAPVVQTQIVPNADR